MKRVVRRCGEEGRRGVVKRVVRSSERYETPYEYHTVVCALCLHSVNGWKSLA